MRETKYNQNNSSRKAPIDRDALWGKISNDPKFPTPEKKYKNRFWLFRGLGLFLLLIVLAITLPKLTDNNTNKNELSSKELSTKESLSNQSLDVNTTSPQIKLQSQEGEKEELTVSLKKGINQKFTTPNNKKELMSQPQTTPSAKEQNTNIEPEYITEPNPNRQSQSKSQLNPITSEQPYQTTKVIEVTPSFKNQDKDISVSQTKTNLSSNPEELQPQLNSFAMLDQLDHSLDILLGVTDYQKELTNIKSKIELLAYANVSYGLSMHNVETIEDREGFDFLDPNVTDYLKNRESRAIEIGIKKTLFKRYRLGLGAEFRQDWQAYKRTDTEISVARDSSIIADGFPLQKMTTDYLLHQKYQSVNLNLSVDRIIPLGWAYLELGAGLGYSLSKESKAKVLDIENRLIDRGEAYTLKSAGSFSGFGQLGLTLPLSENWRLSVNARYNIPNQLSRNIEEYSHKLSAIRLGMAIGYQF